MIRKAFLMTLKPGCWVEYERRHNPIWPELEAMLRTKGVTNYSIFLDRGSSLLLSAYAEVKSEEQWRQIAETEVCQRWWARMKDLMLTNEDNSPVVSGLDEVFHMD